MSTMTSYDDALDFLPSAKPSPKRQSFLARVRVIASAVHEGHVAATRYQELRSRGIAHDEAAKRVFAEVYSAR